MEDEDDNPGVVKKGGKQVRSVSNWEVKKEPKPWKIGKSQFRKIGGFQHFDIAGEEEDHEGRGSQQMFLEKLAAQ